MKRKPSLLQRTRPVKQSKTAPAESLRVESLSHEGRGVARHGGKTLFISGALPGEEVKYRILKQHRRFDEAECTEVLEPSPQRVTPACPHYTSCGGCDLQHLSADEQVRQKQTLVLDQLQRLGKLVPLEIEAPITGPVWQYRRSCRIGINQRQRDGSPLVGFRRRNSKQLTAVEQCPVALTAINQLLSQLPDTLSGTENFKQITHAELTLGDNGGALTLRVRKRLPTELQDALNQLANNCNLSLFLQADQGRPEPVAEPVPELYYALPDQQLKIFFQPGDFIQVNAEINRQMINRALAWLNVETTDRVLDLFCGIGNFTLPLATQAASVVGVEGVMDMVERATANAHGNELNNCEFYRTDLSKDLRAQPWFRQGFDKILLDPPRTGALELIQQLGHYQARAILYVSCNPAALARDGAELVKQGYQLSRFCIMDMFPQTSHVESLALFEKA